MSDQNKDAPKIIVDDDWKAQAEAEKQRLAAEQKAAPAEPGPTGEPSDRLPPADFETIVSTMASQALFALGAMPDPSSGQRYVNLDLAKFQIDSLKVLEEKTRGNLSEEEAGMLDRTLYELRTAYVQMAQRASGL